MSEPDSKNRCGYNETDDLLGAGSPRLKMEERSPRSNPFNGRDRKSKSPQSEFSSKDLQSLCSEAVWTAPGDTTHTQLGVYRIREEHKGRVLILSNTFSGDLIISAADTDNENVNSLWTKLGCEVLPKYNLAAKDMKYELKKFAETEKDKFDFLVIVIMSHGGMEGADEVFYGNDFNAQKREEGVSVKVSEALEYFNNANAKNLCGIPKFFIFEFCRGKKNDTGSEFGNRGGDSISTPDYLQILFPETSDIIVAYATQPNHLARTNNEKGSWLTNAIVNIFWTHAKDKHVTDMLTMVNAEMLKMTGKKGDRKDIKAMSSYVSSLTKHFYLFAGLPK